MEIIVKQQHINILIKSMKKVINAKHVPIQFVQYSPECFCIQFQIIEIYLVMMKL